MCYLLVPVLFGDSVKRAKDQRQDDLTVLLDQTQNILIVPEIQSPLCNLTHTHTDIVQNRRTGNTSTLPALSSVCYRIQIGFPMNSLN